MKSKNLEVCIGDLYECEGRIHTKWIVDKIIDVPSQGKMVQLKMIDGLAKVTFPAAGIGLGHGFQPING